MERLYIVNSTDTKDVSVCISILYISPVFSLGVRNRSTSSFKHPLFPLCVCIYSQQHWFHSLLSTFIRQASDIYMYLTSLWHTTLVRSFAVFFGVQIFDSFVNFWMKTNDANPETPKLWFSAVSYLHTLCVHWSVGPVLNADEITVYGSLMERAYEIRTQWVRNRCSAIFYGRQGFVSSLHLQVQRDRVLKVLKGTKPF